MSLSVELICIDPERIFDFWQHARPLIKSAVDRTELSDFECIEREILDGDQLLWLAWSDRIEAAATTKLGKVGERKICTLTACAGYQRDRWLPLFAQIEKYAKDEGAAVMRIYGRKGWERTLKDYHVEHVVLEKELS